MAAPLTSKLKFRYDINALRAIAILGVLFFHYKVEFIAGGFSGVDIFFVISGYLMSRIILTSINKNEFSFKDYYSKRLKRIVPALLFLISILTILGFFLYLPEDYKVNQKNAASSILFLSNILYWKSSDYFNPVSDTNILLHTWSLSVEWQFYLLYPLVLLLLSKIFKNKSAFVLFFVGSTITIAILSIIFTNYKPTASFYLLPTRSWEMMFGGIALFAEDLIKSYKWRKVLAITGYTLILACLVLLKTTMLWPGIYTVLPVFATFLVIIANYNDFEILKNDGIQFIGRISYSLYLWHWPVYVIAQYFGLETDFGSVILFTITSITLGYISYKYVEAFTFNNSRLIMASMVILLVGTSALSFFNTNNIMFKPKTLEIANYRKNHDKEVQKRMSIGKCFLTSTHKGLKDFNKESCLCLDKNKKNILLIGDSHAAHLAAILREALYKKNINLLQATSSGGFPIVKSNGEPRFKEVMDFLFKDFIIKNAREIDGVIISSNWALAYNKGISPDELSSDLIETINFFKKHGIKPIVIGQSEVYHIPYSTIAAKEYEYGINLDNKYLNDNAYIMNKTLRKSLGPYYINIINVNSFPPLSSNNVPYIWDISHFTEYGADLTKNKILSSSAAKKLF